MSSTKDPAVLFYTADFLTGVSGLTMEERGQYITLLCYQHQHGPLTEKIIRLSVGEISDDVRAKFNVDDEGRLYNERMMREAERRRSFIESRTKSSHARFSKTSYDRSCDDRTIDRGENENININTIKYIVSILNDKLGTKYKYSSEYIARLIKARLGEGFTPEDFETVISKKLQEWKGTRFEKFLRPETLFGTKFQSYLNEICTEQPPIVPKYSDSSAEAALQEAIARSYGG